MANAKLVAVMEQLRSLSPGELEVVHQFIETELIKECEFDYVEMRDINDDTTSFTKIRWDFEKNDLIAESVTLHHHFVWDITGNSLCDFVWGHYSVRDHELIIEWKGNTTRLYVSNNNQLVYIGDETDDQVIKYIKHEITADELLKAKQVTEVSC